MGMYCFNMLAIALELATENRAYEDLASKFFAHFVYIAHAIHDMGDEDLSLWDEEDGFDHPYILHAGDMDHRVDYEPAESSSSLFGGNSNWRGPVWFPVNYLLIESLRKFDYFYGETFTAECPTGSGRKLDLWQVAAELSRRLTRIFLRDGDGRRPVYGGSEPFQRDPHWRDLISFYESFHGDNGAGIGASHQTGWTGLVAKLLQQSGE